MSETCDLVTEARKELSSHIGYQESGNNNTPFNREFGRIPGYPHDGFGYPWCHSFLSVSLKRIGMTAGVTFPYTAGCEAGVAWFKARKRFGSTPRAGAFVYFGPGGGTHVEWVEKVTDTSIVTIGGNTSGALAGQYFNGDGVYRKTISRSSSRIYGYGYPNYEEDDMPSAKEVADAVYERFSQTLPADVWAVKEGIFKAGDKIDPKTAFRQIWAYTKRADTADREILAQLKAQDVTIKTLVDALAAREVGLDPAVLIEQIREEIGKVSVRLTVADE